MDIARPDQKRKRRRQRILYSMAGLSALVLITIGLSRLKPAAPIVTKSSVYSDTVKRGEMLRQVRGNGTLVPVEIRWIPAANLGRVERILVLPGAVVKADDILVELSNPELEQAAFDAEWALKAAEAELINVRVQLESQRLSQEAIGASLKSDLSLARLDAEADTTLAKEGLVAELTAKRSRAKADELRDRYEI